MAQVEALKNNPLPDAPIGGEDADLLRIARERYQEAIDAEFDNREAALEDLEFMAGHQWPEEIRRERHEDSRPILTINRMPQFVHQVTGDLRQNKMAIKVRPADDVADEDVAEVYTGLVRHIEAASDATTAYITAAEGAAQCGIGHFRIVTKYAGDDIFDQDIRIQRITDQFSVTWDPHGVEVTRKDARYCFVEESLDIETFKARYPNASLSGWDIQSPSHSNYGYLGDWLKHETVRIAEYWTVTLEERTLAQLGDNRVVDVTDLPASDGYYFTKDGDLLDVKRSRKAWRNKVEMRLINGIEVLEGPFEWPGRYIPIVSVLGEEIFIGRRNVRHGVVRHAKDPQRMYNYWRSAQTEYIALQPKAPYMVTADNITGFEAIWRQANTRNQPYLPYTPDKLNRGMPPKREAPPLASQGMAQEILVASEDMKATTGIYDAGLGARSNEVSGKAIIARKTESDVSTFTYADNLARALRHAGAILVDLIPVIYDTARMIRILNEDDTTKAVEINQTVVDEDGETRILNDLTLGKYDVVVSTGPSYTTKRAEAAEGMMALVGAMPEVGKLIMDLLVKNLDWPGADEIADRLRKILPPGLVETPEGEAPPPEAPPDPEIVKARADLEIKGRELELKGREADRKDAEAAAKIAETLAETEAKELENHERQLMLGLMESPEMAAMIERLVVEAVSGMIDQNRPGALTNGSTPSATPPVMQ